MQEFVTDDSVRMIEPIRKIAAETGYRPVEVDCAPFAHDAHVREGRCTGGDGRRAQA